MREHSVCSGLWPVMQSPIVVVRPKGSDLLDHVGSPVKGKGCGGDSARGQAVNARHSSQHKSRDAPPGIAGERS